MLRLAFGRCSKGGRRLSAEVVLSGYPAHSISLSVVFSIWEAAAGLFLTHLCASDAQTATNSKLES